LHGFSCHFISNFGIIITLFAHYGTEKTMKESRLDSIDRKIIAELQADGRMTNVDLARRVGVSAPPCLRRVRALEKAGFIHGYHANVDAKMLGFGVTVFAMVGLDSQAESDLQAFETRVHDWPEVRECHMLNGDIDFIFEMRGDGFREFSSVSNATFDVCAQCRACAHLADHSPIQAGGGCADRFDYENVTLRIS
jgi:DNA-binding Lrp family transcriptional regulator